MKTLLSKKRPLKRDRIKRRTRIFTILILVLSLGWTVFLCNLIFKIFA